VLRKIAHSCATPAGRVDVAASDASGSIVIAATPARVYALITDLAELATLADETEAMHWTKGSAAVPQAVFRGANRNGRHRWTTTCTVTHAEAGHRFAFDVSYPPGLSISRWQYDIESMSEGCRVTETTWDRRPGWFAALSGLATGIRDRGAANQAHIDATLSRLKARAEARR
jgi:hypothetical protein